MDTSLFRVRSERRGACAHLHLSGELDIATAPILEGLLEEVEGEGISAIIVDLQNLTFMDASGLHSFLRAADRASRSGRRFGIVYPPAIAQRILKITKTTFLIDRPPVPRRASRMQTMSDHAH